MMSLLLLQIAIILFVSRVFGYGFQKLNQPAVIGEILAGIVLGPSLLGWLSPKVFHAIFPVASRGGLDVLSQIGLLLFVFVVGLELDFKSLKKMALKALVISQSSIWVSLLFGMLMAMAIFPTYASNTSVFQFAFFIGIALSVTAFPVLVRIVRDRQMGHTRLGTLVIASAAIDDISAWVLLSIAIMWVKAGSPTIAIFSIGLTILYIVLMLAVARPLMNHLIHFFESRGIKNLSFSAVMIAMVLSSIVSEQLGIHALFGAFLAGISFSGLTSIKHALIHKIEDIALFLLLPLFFAFSGLKTQIALMNTYTDWMVCGAIIVVAIAGKLIGSGLAAKSVGESWHDSAVIAVLMNARGLVELVVLNIGYDLGVIQPKLFTMLVVMALVTTFMTGPSLNAVSRALNRTC